MQYTRIENTRGLPGFILPVVVIQESRVEKKEKKKKDPIPASIPCFRPRQHQLRDRPRVFLSFFPRPSWSCEPLHLVPLPAAAWIFNCPYPPSTPCSSNPPSFLPSFLPSPFPALSVSFFRPFRHTDVHTLIPIVTSFLLSSSSPPAQARLT